MKVYARDLRGIFIRVRLFESHKRNSIPHANPFMVHLKGLTPTNARQPPSPILFWPLLRHTNPQIKLHPALLPHLLGIYERNESEAAQWENFEELMGQFTHHLFLPLHLPLSYLHLNAMQAGESLFLSLCLCARFLLDFHIIWILIEIKAAARVLHA